MNDKFYREITSYVQKQTPVSAEETRSHLHSLGMKCSINNVRRHLRSLGLAPRHTPENKWLWYPLGASGNTERPSEPETTEIKKSEKTSDAAVLERTEATNADMYRERTCLLEALQKAATLRCEIRSAQEKLLIEIADLIHTTYGAREPKAASESD